MNKLSFIRIICYVFFSLTLFGMIKCKIVTNIRNKMNSYAEIYDRNGFLLAYTEKTYELMIIPDEIINEELVFKSVSKYISETSFKTIIHNKKPVCIFKDYKKPQIIKERGILIVAKNQRKYPMKSAITTIGFVDESRGLCKGIEKIAMNHNKPIITTIDWRIQFTLARILLDTVKIYNGDYAFGILVNKDGEIEAMHATNTIDPNNPKDFINPLTSLLFEFASTCKIYVAYAGLHMKSFNENTIFDMNTGRDVGGRHIPDIDSPPPIANIEGIINKSSNIGTIAAIKVIGVKYLDFLLDLQLNKPVPMDIVTTPQPIFTRTKYLADVCTMGFGYSYQISAMNHLQALLSIINNGQLIRPRLLKSTPKTVVHTLNFNSSYSILHKILRSTAARHQLFKDLNIGSKTGTAHQWRNNHYDPTHMNNFWICFIPDETGNFKYILLLGLINPQPPQLAGILLKKAGFAFVKFMTTHLLLNKHK